MIAAVWLMLSGLFCSLQLQTGSFPKPLTEQEERHYLELSAKGDLEARNILIERNLRLVAHIMKKYYTQTADQEDLVSIGTIGLIKGITTFDRSKGARLATYAARCIENAILSRMHKKQGAEWSVPFPVLRRGDPHRFVQYNRFLDHRAVQSFALLDCEGCVDIAYPTGQFFFSRACLRMEHRHMKRFCFWDRYHLPENTPCGNEKAGNVE